MSEVNYSIDNLFNIIYDEVKDIVKSINNARCSCCRGYFLNNTCKYCHTVDKNVEGMIEKLNSKILEVEQILSNNKITDVPVNKLFNKLMILKKRDIPKVNEILNKFNYRNNFAKKFNVMYDKMTNFSELDDMEIDISESVITGDLYEEQLIVLYNYFISATIRGYRNIDYNCFEMLIKKFCEFNMKNVFKIVNCEISDEMDENLCGSVLFGTRMKLNKRIIKDFYNHKNIELIYTIAHELVHVEQRKRLFVDDLMGDYVLLELKENLIHKFNSKYYHDNYINVSFEKEARYLEKIYGLEYLKSIGFPIEMPEVHKELLKELEKKLYEQERIYNGQITTLEEVFCDTIYNHPEVLSQSGYEKLNFFYKIVNNKVVPKTASELEKESGIMLNKVSNEEEREVISKMYNDHIENSMKYYGNEEMTRR